jgi:hypothetical protein
VDLFPRAITMVPAHCNCGTPVRVESHMRGRVFRLLYVTAIAVAMIGWLWLLIEAIARAID